MISFTLSQVAVYFIIKDFVGPAELLSTTLIHTAARTGSDFKWDKIRNSGRNVTVRQSG